MGRKFNADSPVIAFKFKPAITAFLNGFVLGRRYFDDHRGVLDAMRRVWHERNGFDPSFNGSFNHLQELDRFPRVIILHRLDEMNLLEVRLDRKMPLCQDLGCFQLAFFHNGSSQPQQYWIMP